MAIYRLTLEVLQGSRESDNEELHVQAEEKLADLRARISEYAYVYPEGTTEAWGKHFADGSMHFDFDTEKSDEVNGDLRVMTLITNFVIDRR